VCRVGRARGVRADAGWWAARVAEGAGDKAMGGPSGERRGERGDGPQRRGARPAGALGFVFSFSISFSFLYLKPDLVLKFKFNHALRV
jgi:hypothetical protein